MVFNVIVGVIIKKTVTRGDRITRKENHHKRVIIRDAHISYIILFCMYIYVYNVCTYIFIHI